MRFKSYLKEGIINIYSKKLKLIRNYFIKAKEKFDESDHDNISVYDLDDILHDVLRKIEDDIFNDINFYIMPEGGKIRGSTKPNLSKGYEFDNYEINLNFDIDKVYDVWVEGTKIRFDRWLNELMEVIEHELIHVEQFRRISKEKDPVKAVNVLRSMKKKKLSYTELDGYLSNKLEMMAHAKNAELELSNGINYETIIKALKSEKGQKWACSFSSSFRAYHNNIKNKYQKTWKKFMKYLIMYLDFRKRRTAK